MKRNYHTVAKQGKANERKLAEYLARNGQMLLPMVQLVEQARMAVDEVIDVVGRKTIEAVLWLSARQVAGTPQQGRKREGDIFWHGTRRGSVYLKERKLGVRKPRLRKKQASEEAEVEIPAYQAMQDRAGLGARMLDIVLNGVSTRSYAGVIPAMAETVGISKSSVSRETIAASEAELGQLLNRRLEGLDLLIIYLDGISLGEQCVIAAVGVDGEGKKHVLGLQEGATENGAAAKSLLEDLVARGLDAGRRRLFVIDGSKALRTAIHAVFGAQGLVQRCQNHKLRNVVERLPKDQQAQTRSLMRAAWRLNAKAGMARLEKLAQWLEREHPDAAASLREGMEECFTINRLDIPPSLHRCLASTNLIESPNGGVRRRTRKVCRWKDKNMAKRWAAAAYLRTERNFRCIMGYKDLWALKAILEGKAEKTANPKGKVA
ncbi:MAG: IS256 family transposase [Terriglobia bacterium]